MAKISTLVQDIYDLMGQGFDIQSEVQKFGQRLAAHLAKRASEQKGPPSLRMSNLGTECNRKLWYMINHPEWSEGLSPDARIKFLFGDMAEELLLWLAQEAGHSVSRQQEEVTLFGVKGHIDGFIDGHLVDCKSASSYGFKKFKEHGLENDDPFGYLIQLGGYAAALGQETASFLALDKSLGHLVLDTYSFGLVDYQALIEQKKSAISQETEPPKLYRDEPDGQSGNRKLGLTCSYCDFKAKCWPGLKIAFYAEKPRFMTKIMKPLAKHILVKDL